MKKFFKGRVGTIFTLIMTLILAGVAIFTAIRLYQLRNVAVAPNVPSSIPHAEGVNQCQVTFAITSPTPTLSPTPTPTITPTPTPTMSPTPSPTPSPVPECNNSCAADTDCPTDLSCSNGYCRNASCSDQTSCVCPTATPTATPTASPTVAPTPTLTPTVPPSGAPNSCNGTCGSDANCMSGYYFCYQGYCRDRSCPDRSDCTCPGATGTPSSTPHTSVPGVQSTPAPTTPALPSSGTDWPTIVGAGIGIFVIMGSLLLAF